MRKKKTILKIVLVITVLAAGLLAMIVVPNFMRARTRGSLTSCKSNLKNIATALELYSTDNKGRYPKSLAQLTPNYLKFIPVCPASNEDDYSETYQVGTVPDTFTFYCASKSHSSANVPDGYPQYSSEKGLIEP